MFEGIRHGLACAYASRIPYRYVPILAKKSLLANNSALFLELERTCQTGRKVVSPFQSRQAARSETQRYRAKTTVAGVGVGTISTDVKPASLNHER